MAESRERPGVLRDRADVLAVLRYWQVSLQQEEALASRPRAHRPPSRMTASRREPTDVARTQPYVRIGAEHASFFIGGRGSSQLRADDAALRFHAHWHRVLQRASPARAGSEHASTGWIAGWPAILFERREEIGTLFRFPVHLEWQRGGQPLEPPKPTRPSARVPLSNRTARPDALIVRAVDLDTGDDDAPSLVSIDRELLNNALGVLDEDIAALEERWAGAATLPEMLRDILKILEPDETAPAQANDAHLFERAIAAIRSRLSPGTSVWPTGIVQDGALMHATYHLQSDLLELQTGARPIAPLIPGTGLWSYLSGSPAPARRRILRGRFRPRGLTDSQRSAAELALGSKLSAVQGPPGTGKTELILNLAAHALIERIEVLAGGHPMPSALFVVASTNNRAVDNVIEPLSEHMAGLSLALRAGNQEVTANETADALLRARSWLQAQDDRDALVELHASLRRFKESSAALAGIQELERVRLERASKLTELREQLAHAPATTEERLDEKLELLAREIARMLRILDSRGKKKLRRLESAWADLVSELPALADPTSDLARALHLPPDLEGASGGAEKLEAWEVALWSAEAAVKKARKTLPKAGGARKKNRPALEKELAELEAQPEPPPLQASARAELEALAHQLYLRALEARERWAIANRAELSAALENAAELLRKQRSIRRLAAKEPAIGLAIQRLYPVWGSTLLSLGNVFEDRHGTIAQLVIDEAGQCHPAHAVSGLMRAEQTLIIGDVHQLAPVCRLSERDEARVRREARAPMEEERFQIFRVHDRASTSAQALADRAVRERPTLVDHFRCHPEIIAISDALAGYGLSVGARAMPALEYSPLSAPVLFESISGVQRRARGSWANEAEARRVLEKLEELRRSGMNWADIAVITPFVGQLELLFGALRRIGAPIDEEGASGADEALALGTVHRFQGGERAVVLFSTVITEVRSLPFVDERINLLNVAVSRAREHLVIFGHEPTLRAGRHTRLLVERAHS